MRPALVGLGLLAVVLLATMAAPTHAQTSVAALLTGADALAPGATSVFFLNVTGGPGAEPGGNYSVRYYITASDVTGGLPLQSGARTVSNATGMFRLNITAPTKEQVITVVAEVNSTQSASFERTTVSKAVTVVTPVVLTATFTNGGRAAAIDVPVRFFVDDKLVGEVKISRIEPGGTAIATLSYLPVGLKVGSHGVRVEADLNTNGVIESDKGEVAVLDLFYKKDPDLSWGVTIAIISVILTVSFVVVRALRRRRRR